MSIDIFSTRTMLDSLHQMKLAKTFLLWLFFKAIETSDKEAVDIDIVKGKRKMAPFVRPTDEGIVLEKEGFNTNSIRPPYLKPKRPTTAAELLKRHPGETIYEGNKTPQQKAQEVLGKDLMELTESITRRKEWMAAQLLNTGKVAIVGEGLNAEVDFLMSADHKITLTGNDLWTDKTNSTPLENLRTWKRKAAQDSGIVPNAAVFGAAVLDAFLAHTEVKSQLNTRRIDLGQIKPEDIPQGATYQGFIEGLDIFTYDEWYIDDAGDEQPMVPVDKIFLGSTMARTSQLHGAIQDLDAMDQGMFAVPHYPKSWRTKDPSIQWLLVQSAPIVCMHQVDAFMVVKAV